jgi:hypothetical protein
MTEIPYRLRHRPRDDRGFVIPFVQFIKPDGKPDFRVMDEDQTVKALSRRLCGLCGEPMRADVFFIGGPLCVQYGHFYDPPMHRECALYAIKACPHLARAKGKYSPIPQQIDGASLVIVGEMNTDKAEWFGLMRSTGYSHGRSQDGMRVIKAKLPWVSVERWREGRLMETA